MEVDFFDPIQLEQMDQVKLMNRTDRKFWFHFDHLQGLLQSITDNYFVLDIEGQNEMPYTTTYYDTILNKLYTSHHNGKLNRYKIRRRSYIASELSFLEIKFKSNKGRTIKRRIPADFGNHSFSVQECDFVKTNTPYSCEDLKPSLINEFSRLTLVNKNFKERCTIDLNLQYKNCNKSVALENLVVVEIKSEGGAMVSPLAIALREHRVKTSGFSKYCIGRAITDPHIKRNAFKGKVRRIEKIIHKNLNAYNKY